MMYNIHMEKRYSVVASRFSIVKYYQFSWGLVLDGVPPALISSQTADRGI